jgi:4-methylaminobutanoate oxidase (formaldehyde-forming)
MGWERANVFAPPGQAPVLDYSWGKPSWLPWSAAEQRATRSSVAVFDQTSFSKYLVSGHDAEATLQWVCTNDVAVPVGTVVYTGLLNRRGTYEADLTVTRVADDAFLLVSGSATTERDQDWIRRNVPAGHDTVVADVTETYAVLGVMGPGSRDLLARVSGTAFDTPFATSRMVRIAGADVRASRITYVGELGWELYVETADAGAVYDALVDGTGAVDAGYYAIESLRLEKGYRAFGRELTPDFGPVDAGLLFACKLRGDVDFLGRAAVEEAKARGPRRRLVSFVVDDPDPMLWGGELVLRDGVPVGQVTSAAWGATVGASVGLAYVADPAGVTSRDWVTSGSYAVDVGGSVHSVGVGLRAPYDPANARIR